MASNTSTVKALTARFSDTQLVKAINYLAAQRAYERTEDEAINAKITAQEDYDSLWRRLTDTRADMDAEFKALLAVCGGQVAQAHQVIAATERVIKAINEKLNGNK